MARKLLITDIGTLAGINREGLLHRAGAQMRELPTINDAYLVATDGIITDFGPMTEVPRPLPDTQVLDAQGGIVMPSFCDSHTHIVYAGSREQEFVDKIQGLSYAEIARRGGGILNSADRLHEMTEDELLDEALVRVREIEAKGTGAVEIKSGYGLNTADELKMLRVIRRIKEHTRMKVVSTFLGAHAVARDYIGRQSEYVDLVVNEMIPAVAAEGLAEFIDVFCDEGFFTPQDTKCILRAGAEHGMRGKIHGQELADSGGVEVAAKCDALSVDHLESMTDRDIEIFRRTPSLMPTALPGTSFFSNLPFAPARKMIDAGLAVAIASDYNPGSTPSGDMKFAVSLACIKMRLLPAEAINAATINSAAAMGLSDRYGSIATGMVANLIVTKPLSSIDMIPYAYTTPIIAHNILAGEVTTPQI